MSLFFADKLFPQGIPVFFNDSTPLQHQSCAYTSEAYKTKYSLQSFYVPAKKDPVLTVKLTLHIFTKNDGSGHWQNSDDSAKGVPFLKTVFKAITNGNTERFSKKRKADYPTPGFKVDYIKDSKIQYELTNIYFYADSNMYYSANDFEVFNYISKVDKKRLDEGMPIVINASRGPGHLSGFNGSPAVVTTAGPGFLFPFLSSHLRHEISHCFGLMHTYRDNAGGEHDRGINCKHPDFLWDIFQVDNLNCDTALWPCNICEENTDPSKITGKKMYSNNVMGGTEPNLWISPLQMGRKRRILHLANQSPGDMRRFVKDMKSSHKKPLEIILNEIWDFDMQMYKDIVIKSGSTLTIKCKLAMAIDGKIKIEQGGKLIIDGGEITCWCKIGVWEGIEIKNEKLKMKNTVELLNGGRIKRSKT